MCGTCGCGHERAPHGHDHGHDHGAPGRVVDVETALLARNDHVAAVNRTWCRERGVFLVNLVSSPGAGKTTLLERTIRDVGGDAGIPIHVIEGDQATSRDADRIRAAGAAAVQVNTGTGCHLDAEMVQRVLPRLAPAPGAMVIVENVGNLVCPALFDLGEHVRVVVASVTEGEDKPLKYPYMFQSSHVMVLNKVDLLPHLSFNLGACLAHAEQVHPGLRVFQVSATRGDGLDAWYTWLRGHAPAAAADQALREVRS